jgi:hypothetical protein
MVYGELMAKKQEAERATATEAKARTKFDKLSLSFIEKMTDVNLATYLGCSESFAAKLRSEF